MIPVSLILMAALAQQSPAVEGMTPYEFTFNTNRPPLYAYVHPQDLEERVSIPVVIDEPWNKRVIFDTIQKSFIEEQQPELPYLRKDRLKKEWLAAGGEEIQDGDGSPYWVLKSDVQKRDRAEAMVREAFPVLTDEVAADVSTAGGMKSGTAEGPGFLRLWGMHLAIAGAALVGLAGVVWWTFKRPWAAV